MKDRERLRLTDKTGVGLAVRDLLLLGARLRVGLLLQELGRIGVRSRLRLSQESGGVVMVENQLRSGRGMMREQLLLQRHVLVRPQCERLLRGRTPLAQGNLLLR
jgi:hypothetical protein